MSDAAADRHQRHEACLSDHDRRLDFIQDQVTINRVWRTGNGNPHRGAEARITRLEERALMKDEMKRLAEEAVAAYQRTMRSKVKDFGPWLLLLAGFAYTAVTGKPPEIGP